MSFTSSCDKTFPVTVVAINGDTLTLKMPAGTLDVARSQLRIVNAEKNIITIIKQQSKSKATAKAVATKSDFAEGSSWRMCGSTTDCYQAFPVTIVAINGDTLTLKMPAGTLDVARSQLQIVNRANGIVAITAKPR